MSAQSARSRVGSDPRIPYGPAAGVKVQSFFINGTIPQIEKGARTYVVALQGHISTTGEIEVAVAWKGCAGPLMLPTDMEPGRSISKHFRKLR